MLTVALILSISATVLADQTNYMFGFNAGTTSGTAGDFGFSGNFKKKKTHIPYIEVRHTVSVGGGYNNLIAAQRDDGPYVGSKWMAPNGIYYPTNGGCKKNSSYAPCGRGNTKYFENQGVSSIYISGQFKVR